jgi:hypothetical protein
MKIVFGEFNAKAGKENIFKPTAGNEGLCEVINDNEVRVVNCATSKNLVVKSTIFPHRKIHKHKWTFQERKKENQIDHVLADGRRHSSILAVRNFRGLIMLLTTIC